MSVRVVIRGLFCVVRDDGRPRSGPQRMVILFPASSEGHGGGHGGGHGNPDAHVARLYIREALLHGRSLPPLLARATSSGADEIPGFVAFDLERLQLRLPMTGTIEPVAHAADEPIGTHEPTPDDCLALTPERFKSLSRLPELNSVMNAELDMNTLATPAPDVVQSRVLLSGGELNAIKSYKALRNSFFELYDEYGTAAIQPIAEDVEYLVEPGPGGTIVIGFSDLNAGAGAPEPFELEPPSGADASIIIQSFPQQEPSQLRDPSASLHHFFLYYPLMRQGPHRHEPFLRVLGTCKDGQVVHTMPRIGDKDKPTFVTTTLRTTSCTTTCAAAQASGVFPSTD
jgi:hypothetical protein